MTMKIVGVDMGSSSANSPPHVLIFPFMGQGHTFPLLDLAMVLSHRGIKVTIITTPSNATQISSHFANLKTNLSSNISTHVIPFPIVDDLPRGCENTNVIASKDQLLPFLRATLKLKQPFESYLGGLVETGDYPICAICDFFLGWAMRVCSSFNIPGILFHGMGVLSCSINHIVFSNEERTKSLLDEGKLDSLPGLACPFPVILEDFPVISDEHDSSLVFLQENGDDGSSHCWGVLSNSFEELEGEFVGALEGSYGREVKVWCVGPLLLYDQVWKFKTSSNVCDKYSLYQSWLDEQEEKQECVLYASFGTQSHISNNQMDEIALGLELAGHRFIWVVRSSNWTPPKGWMERVKDKGLVIREWVDQRSIFAHPATKGFLSHCGWNSVLESLSMGVPMLAWPMNAEQPHNAKFVVQVLKAGLAIGPKLDETDKEDVRFGSKAISSGVEELMGGEGGKLARERAESIQNLAGKAVEKDGSSSKRLDQLISSLKQHRSIT